MRSRTEWLERVLRAAGLLALAAALLSTSASTRTSRARSVDSLFVAEGALDSSFVRSLTRGSRGASHLLLRGVPDDTARALLQAVRDAGWPLSWSTAEGVTLPALAVSVHALREPSGGTLVRATADGAPWLTLSDEIGWVDSVTLARRPVAWTLPSTLGRWCVRVERARACASGAVADARPRVRLYGAPGWDAQFTMRALEEAGYAVDAQVSVAPRVRVRVGPSASLDTSSHVAVIALDSTAWADAGTIARFVGDGGGLLALADAVHDAPRAFPVATPLGAELPAVPGALRGDAVLDGLPLRPPRALPAEAVVFERSARPGRPVIVLARRVGAGRVVQAGVRDVWTWRMTGGEGAPDAHRRWWATQLTRAVGASRSPDGVEAWYGGTVAPLADLHARLGPPAAPARLPASDASGPTRPSPWWLVVAATALVSEWWLRRLRGAR